MEHKKNYYRLELNTTNGPLIIEGPISSNQLASYDFHEDLKTFRPSQQQKNSLINIANRPEGRVNVAVHNNTVVAYIVFVYPDPLERWSEGNMINLIELGAIEVIPQFRGNGVGKSLLKISMLDDAMEDYIIITTEYYWHWDLKGTGLDVWRYRRVMEKMMNAGGLEWYATDEPEICSHPANCLMARIGKRVDNNSIEQFNRLRFKKLY